MQKLKQLFSAVIQSLSTSWNRYPEALVFAYLLGALIISRIHADNGEFFFGLSYDNLMLTAVTAISLSLLIATLVHCQKLSGGQRLVADGAGLLIVVLCYLNLPASLTAPDGFRIVVVNVSLLLAVTLIPFLWRQDNYDISVIQLMSRAATTLLYAVVLIVGIVAIYASIDGLLGIGIDEKLYIDSIVIILMMFCPTYFLGDIPTPQMVDGLMVDPLFERLFIYIVMPLLLVYSLILYLYFGRIVISWTLPSNMIVHMVTWYSLITILSIFFSHSYWQNYALGRWFYRYMPVVLVVPLAMLMLSLYLRIAQYGFTVQRYFVMAMTIWLVLTTLYFIIDRRRHFQYIVVAAVAIMLLSMYGPQNAFDISFNSQLQRLESLLIKHDMLRDDAIVANSAVDANDQREIIEGLRYFSRNQQQARVPFIPDDFRVYDDTTTLLGFNYPNEGYVSDYRPFVIGSPRDISYPLADAKRFYVIKYFGVPTDDSAHQATVDTELVLHVTVDDNSYAFDLRALVVELAENAKSDDLHLQSQDGRAKLIIDELTGFYQADQQRYTINQLKAYLFTRQ